MYKIENFLLIKADNADTISVIKQFLKETDLLISNLYSIYVLEKKPGASFPYVGEEYDTAWYKNILIAAMIIEDRLNGQIMENKPYVELLNRPEEVTFSAFARRWNAINLIFSFNSPSSEWIKISGEYKLSECASKLQALINAQPTFDNDNFKKVALNLNDYKKVTIVSNETTNTAITNTDAGQDLVTVEVTSVDATTSSDDANHTYEDRIPFDNLDIHITNESTDTNIKELDLVLNWLKNNESQIKKYKNIARLGTTNVELEHIEKLISELDSEIKSNNALLNTIIAKLPENPYLKQYVELAKWNDERTNILNTHLEISKNDAIPAQISNIETEIKNTEQEIFLIDSTLQLISENKPDHPALVSVEATLNWIEQKQQKLDQTSNA